MYHLEMQISLKCVATVVSSKDYAEAVLFDMRAFKAPEYAEGCDQSESILGYIVAGLLHAMGREPLLRSASSHMHDNPENMKKPPADTPRVSKHLEPENGSKCQLLAAVALVQLAALPDKHCLPDPLRAWNRGPFREILCSVGLQEHLLWLRELQWEDSLRSDVDAIVAYGTMILSTPGQPLSLHLLLGITGCLKSQIVHKQSVPKDLQLLCFAMWTLCQNPVNLKNVWNAAGGIECCIRVLKTFFDLVAILETQTRQAGIYLDVLEVAQGIEAAVLLLWRLTAGWIGDQQTAACMSSCFVSSTTTWWELPMKSK